MSSKSATPIPGSAAPCASAGAATAGATSTLPSIGSGTLRAADSDDSDAFAPVPNRPARRRAPVGGIALYKRTGGSIGYTCRTPPHSAATWRGVGQIIYYPLSIPDWRLARGATASAPSDDYLAVRQPQRTRLGRKRHLARQYHWPSEMRLATTSGVAAPDVQSGAQRSRRQVVATSHGACHRTRSLAPVMPLARPDALDVPATPA